MDLFLEHLCYGSGQFKLSVSLRTFYHMFAAHQTSWSDERNRKSQNCACFFSNTSPHLFFSCLSNWLPRFVEMQKPRLPVLFPFVFYWVCEIALVRCLMGTSCRVCAYMYLVICAVISALKLLQLRLKKIAGCVKFRGWSRYQPSVWSTSFEMSMQFLRCQKFGCVSHWWGSHFPTGPEKAIISWVCINASITSNMNAFIIYYICKFYHWVESCETGWSDMKRHIIPACVARLPTRFVMLLCESPLRNIISER